MGKFSITMPDAVEEILQQRADAEHRKKANYAVYLITLALEGKLPAGWHHHVQRSALHTASSTTSDLEC